MPTIIKQTIKTRITEIQDTKNTCIASTLFWGSIIACEYCNVLITTATDTTELNVPNKPKSDGLNIRLRIGDNANDRNCAIAVPDITIDTFLTNVLLLWLAKKCKLFEIGNIICKDLKDNITIYFSVF